MERGFNKKSQRTIIVFITGGTGGTSLLEWKGIPRILELDVIAVNEEVIER